MCVGCFGFGDGNDEGLRLLDNTSADAPLTFNNFSVKIESCLYIFQSGTARW